MVTKLLDATALPVCPVVHSRIRTPTDPHSVLSGPLYKVVELLMVTLYCSRANSRSRSWCPHHCEKAIYDFSGRLFWVDNLRHSRQRASVQLLPLSPSWAGGKRKRFSELDEWFGSLMYFIVPWMSHGAIDATSGREHVRLSRLASIGVQFISQQRSTFILNIPDVFLKCCPQCVSLIILQKPYQTAI